MPSPSLSSLSGTTSNPTSGGGLDPSANPHTIDFAGNFLASPAWEARILTPLSNPNVNYTFGSRASISSIAWVAASSSSSSSSGPNETTIDSLAIGGTARVESSTMKWLSRGEHATGEHFITIQVQSWLRQKPDDSMGGNGGSGGRMAGDSNSLGGGGGGGGSSSSSYAPRPGDYMRLRIEWTKQQGSSTKGSSTSGLFTVADSVEGVSDKWSRDIVQGFDNDKLNGSDEPATATATATTKTATPPASDAATGTGSSSQSVATNNPGQSSGSSSLSTGAIAGIAVGCGIGLILGGTALVWFFMTRRRRRRRRQHSSKQGYDAHDKATALMDDNRNSVANVADSPQPPHSEDKIVHDSSRHAHQPVHSAAGVPPRGESWRDGPSRAANFAERGMTDDERRRWEEEERHLDDEIARNKAL